MKLPAVLLLAAPVGIAANDPQSGCACKATPNSGGKQTAASGKPAYPGNAAAYGWGCKAHDSGSEQMFVVGWNGTDCDGDTAAGTANDWCEDMFCIVEPSACDVRKLRLTYTADGGDWFSYEACYSGDAFKGNGWVGRCQNCPTHIPGTSNLGNSYCACSDGVAGCMCVATPTAADGYSAGQSNVAGKPLYPGNAPAYGWGCKAHDSGSEQMFVEGWNGTTCDGDTAAGTAADWCEDKWCIVDTNKCTGRNLKISYTVNPWDYFTYETCDSAFAGNGWVGRCTGSQTADTADLADSYYTCDDPMPIPTPSPSPTPDADLASQRGLAAVGATLLAAAIFQ